MTNPRQQVALVGCGYWGKNLARNFLALGALHTLCDADADTLKQYGDPYSKVRKTQDFDSVLADSAIVAVAIAAPAPLHHALAKAALLAGKDVFVEKPLCLNVSEAEELIEIAEAHQRILMVGHLLQYHPAIEELRKRNAAGFFGKIYSISSHRLSLGKLRREENVLWSFAPHDISILLSLSGDAPPTQIEVEADNFLDQTPEDACRVSMRFASGSAAYIHVSWLHPEKEQKLTIIGEKAMAVFDDTLPWEQKLRVQQSYISRQSEDSLPTLHKGPPEFVSLPETEPLKAECAHFLDCCHNRQRPRTDGREGLRVLKVLSAAQSKMNAKQTPAPDYFAHDTAVIDPKASIGKGTKVWHFSHVSDDAVIGTNCSFGQNCYVAPGVSVGNGVKVQNNVSLYTGVTIEDEVFLGPSCVFTNVINPRAAVNRKNEYKPTVVKKGATIGANATIICGVTIGEYAFVAAGAVVTKDVPDHALMKGVPARQDNWMGEDGAPCRSNLTQTRGIDRTQ